MNRASALLSVVLLASVGACTRTRATVPSDVAGFCRLDASPVVESTRPHEDSLFDGLEVLARRIPSLADLPPSAAADVRPARLEALESEFRAVLPSVGLTNTKALFIYGWSLRVEATPARCVEVMLDVAAEKAALSADEAEPLGEQTTHDGTRRVVRMALLDMGESVFKFDFRWTFAGTSRLRADGVALVRYDFLRDDRPQRVSAFSGVALVTPEANGSRITEILAVGSTVSPPFFLKGTVRSTIEDILTKRARRLAERISAR